MSHGDCICCTENPLRKEDHLRACRKIDALNGALRQCVVALERAAKRMTKESCTPPCDCQFCRDARKTRAALNAAREALAPPHQPEEK